MVTTISSRLNAGIGSGDTYGLSLIEASRKPLLKVGIYV